MDDLKKRHVIVVNQCCICKKNGGSMDHCEIASTLWSSIFSCVGLAQAMLRQVVDLFASQRGHFGKPQNSVVGKMVPSCLISCLCKERNDQIGVHEWTMVELEAFFFQTLYHQEIAFDFNISSFFVFCFSSLMLIKCISCILSVYLGWAFELS